MNKAVLLEYVKIFEQLNNNSLGSLSDSQRELISFINDEAYSNDEFRKFIEQLRESDNKEEMIEKYFNDLEIKSSGSHEEVIANAFGIDVSQIDHMYLDNGREIFKFYSEKQGKYVVLENDKNGVSLVSQLKEIQSQNENYQTNDGEKNSQAILEDKRFKENCELDMVPVDEVSNHVSRIQQLSTEDYYKINFMIKNSSLLGITAINIENVVGIDNYGKIYEVQKNNINDQFMISEPDVASYNDVYINTSTSDRIDDSYSFDEHASVLSSDYEDESNVVVSETEEEVYKFYDLPEDIQEKTIMFYQYPEMFAQLSEEDREIWNEYLSMYAKVLMSEEKEREKENSNVRRYVKIKEESYGYINLPVLSLIICFVILLISLVVVNFS